MALIVVPTLCLSLSLLLGLMVAPMPWPLGLSPAAIRDFDLAATEPLAWALRWRWPIALASAACSAGALVLCARSVSSRARGGSGRA